MKRLFVNEISRKGDFFKLSDEQLHHLKVAKRFKKLLCCYQEVYYECKLEGDRARIIKKLNVNNEFKKPIYLGISFIKLKNIELIIQKAVELGVWKIYLFPSQNTERKNVFDLKKKIDRFNKLVISASEQSFRNITTKIKSVDSFNEILEIKEDINKFIAYEGKVGEKTPSTLPINSIILIGPEGGFTREEIKIAEKNGFKSISLGKRILRSETAAIYSLSKIEDDSNN